MRSLLATAWLLSALLAGCGAPGQSDANPVINSVFEPAAPLVDDSVPPPLPQLPRPSRRGSIATAVDADGDRTPTDFRIEDMISGVLPASWHDRSEALTVRLLAWQVVIDDRPLLVEEAILWMHFHEQGKREFWQLVRVYRHPRETAPHLQGWQRANRSPHSDKTGSAAYDEKPDSATVIRFLSASGWGEVHSGFTLLDAGISAGAWKRATGEAPGFAYP